MEEIIINIMQRLSEAMPQLSLIDEDYGQLETEEDTYPVTFPCVLIGNLAIDWADTTSLCQKGTGTLTARLAIDCYDDTHVGSGTEDRIAVRQRMAQDVYKALQGFRPSSDTGRLSRRKSVQYAIRGGVKVYELTFAFTLHDDSAE